ncbi:MAG: hypothetical protein R3257_00090 [bacterium]|nr:hypothetical protein [bacterium]
MNKKLKSGLIAAAAAGLFLSGTGLAVTPASAAVTGKCKIKNNSCKGKAACGCPTKPLNLCAEGETHTCAGKNSCKGQGWVYLSGPDGKPLMVTEEECGKKSPSIFKAQAPAAEKTEKK